MGLAAGSHGPGPPLVCAAACALTSRRFDGDQQDQQLGQVQEWPESCRESELSAKIGDNGKASVYLHDGSAFQPEHAGVLKCVAYADWETSQTLLSEYFHVFVDEDTLTFLANAADVEEIRGNRAAFTRLCHQWHLVSQVHLFAEGLQWPPREAVERFFKPLKLARPWAEFLQGTASYLEHFLVRTTGTQRELVDEAPLDRGSESFPEDGRACFFAENAEELEVKDAVVSDSSAQDDWVCAVCGTFNWNRRRRCRRCRRSSLASGSQTWTSHPISQHANQYVATSGQFAAKEKLEVKDELDLKNHGAHAAGPLGGRRGPGQGLPDPTWQHADVDAAENGTFNELNDALFDGLQREVDAERDSTQRLLKHKACVQAQAAINSSTRSSEPLPGAREELAPLGIDADPFASSNLCVSLASVWTLTRAISR